MADKNMVLKAKKRLLTLLLVYLGTALIFIGISLFMMLSSKKGEALNLSELVLNGTEKEGQYVALEIDTLPILMVPVSEKDSHLYYIKDVNNRVYIINLSNETFRSISKTINLETGKLNSAYQLKGTITAIDEQTKNMALSNGYRIFKNNELSSDTFSEYLGEFYIKENFVNQRMAALCTIFALIGLFFLVLAFGYVVPVMVKVNKGDFGILDEKNMRQSLEKYLPDGETLAAGIHGVGIQTEIKQVFGKCIYDGERLVPDENGNTLQVTKSKVSKFDVYVGITKHYLILSECEKYKHLYEFNDVPNFKEASVQKIDTCILPEDIGTCFPLSEIRNCEIKNAWMGAVNCSITMKNGSFIKLMLPKNGGPAMPHHTEYREKVIACLNAHSMDSIR